VIKNFNKPKQDITRVPEPSQSPLIADVENNGLEPVTQAEHRQDITKDVQPPHPHSPSFDLWLARGSISIEVIFYTLMAACPTPLVFIFSGMAISFGGGFNPAVQALALELYVKRNSKLAGEVRNSEGDRGSDGEVVGKKAELETGRLFGAISVVSSISYVSFSGGGFSHCSSISNQ
jgi:hypothetical protein